jgi:hypothetical protein
MVQVQINLIELPKKPCCFLATLFSVPYEWIVSLIPIRNKDVKKALIDSGLDIDFKKL